MDVSRINKDYTCITDEQVEFLNEVVQSKNKEKGFGGYLDGSYSRCRFTP